MAAEWPTADANAEPGADEVRLVAALRQGDEAAFMMLVEQYHASLVRLAQLYVQNRDQAEEVAQEAWLGVLRGIERFEGRSSLRTWLFRILTNIAKTRGQREARSIPFSAMWSADAAPDEPAVDPERFLPADHPQWPNHWSSMIPSWDVVPEDHLMSVETRQRISAAIAVLPPTQREVITLRDVEGWTSEEVCNALSISETNQRVLLHRARSKVRHVLDAYLQEA